ncbi:MAG: hypothetical protein ACK4Z7_01320 [Novosphingobium sp.]
MNWPGASQRSPSGLQRTKGFEAGDAPRLAIDHRLIEQLETVGQVAVVEQARDGGAILHRRLVVRAEDHDRAVGLFLGLVERGIGPF